MLHFFCRNIPENYHVLFLSAGGTGQTAGIALNLMQLKPNKCADYFVTGKWSEKAAKEASKFGTIHKVLPKMESYGCKFSDVLSVCINVWSRSVYSHIVSCSNSTMYD